MEDRFCSGSVLMDSEGRPTHHHLPRKHAGLRQPAQQLRSKRALAARFSYTLQLHASAVRFSRVLQLHASATRFSRVLQLCASAARFNCARRNSLTRTQSLPSRSEARPRRHCSLLSQLPGNRSGCRSCRSCTPASLLS